MARSRELEVLHGFLALSLVPQQVDAWRANPPCRRGVTFSVGTFGASVEQSILCTLKYGSIQGYCLAAPITPAKRNLRNDNPTL